MRYLLAIILPPVAVLLCGKPIQMVLNLLLCIVYVPAVIHAILVVNKYYADQRHAEMLAAMKRS